MGVLDDELNDSLSASTKRSSIILLHLVAHLCWSMHHCASSWYVWGVHRHGEEGNHGNDSKGVREKKDSLHNWSAGPLFCLGITHSELEPILLCLHSHACSSYNFNVWMLHHGSATSYKIELAHIVTVVLAILVVWSFSFIECVDDTKSTSNISIFRHADFVTKWCFKWYFGSWEISKIGILVVVIVRQWFCSILFGQKIVVWLMIN